MDLLKGRKQMKTNKRVFGKQFKKSKMKDIDEVNESDDNKPDIITSMDLKFSNHDIYAADKALNHYSFEVR